MIRSRSRARARCRGRSIDIAPGLDAVDVGQIADVPADLGGEVGLEVFGPSLAKQRVGVVFVGHDEFEVVDDVADARSLLGRSEHEHGLVGRRDLARECDVSVGGADLDRELGDQGPAWSPVMTRRVRFWESRAVGPGTGLGRTGASAGGTSRSSVGGSSAVRGRTARARVRGRRPGTGSGAGGLSRLGRRWRLFFAFGASGTHLKVGLRHGPRRGRSAPLPRSLSPPLRWRQHRAGRSGPTHRRSIQSAL